MVHSIQAVALLQAQNTLVHIEDKGYTISVHAPWRGLSAMHKAIVPVVDPHVQALFQPSC